jgi:hypothetical protein
MACNTARVTERLCSFCQKAPPDVQVLIGGPGLVAICERCVALCVSSCADAGVALPAVTNNPTRDAGGGWMGATGQLRNER